MRKCDGFTPARSWKNTRVLLVTLLTHDVIFKCAISNFESVDRFLLGEGMHVLWHMPIEIKMPSGLTYMHSRQEYEYHRTPRGHTFIASTVPLLLPRGIKSFSHSTLTHPPKYCHPKHNQSYSLATRYYAHQMLRLRILEEYEYFMKVDADVRIVRDIDVGSLLQRSVFVHTATFAKDNPLCDATALSTAKAYCTAKWIQPHRIYYSNFVIGWMGLFASDEVNAFSAYHWDRGWDFRWGDQTFWRYALLVTNTTQRVVDASFLRKDGYFQHQEHAPKRASVF